MKMQGQPPEWRLESTTRRKASSLPLYVWGFCGSGHNQGFLLWPGALVLKVKYPVPYAMPTKSHLATLSSSPSSKACGPVRHRRGIQVA